MELCPWESAQYFVYSSNIPALFFYSHIPAIIAALVAGFIVYYKSGGSKMGKILLAITLLFSTWTFIDLILWATNRPDVVIFFWSLQILIEPIIFVFSFYLVFYFIKNKDFSFWQLFFIILPVLPLIFLLNTELNLIGVDTYDCTAIEGFLAQYYSYILEIFFIGLIFIFSIINYSKEFSIEKKKEIRLFSIGVVLFLLAFSWGNTIGSIADNWALAQAGLIGMPIFVAFLSYIIIRFKTFHVKLLGVQVLVGALMFFIVATLFVRTIAHIKIIIFATLVLVAILGYYLILSVKKEIEQKEKLMELNMELESLITQRESLMHLITHKVKGAFTRSKYIFAGLLDGSFGAITEEVRKISDAGLKSDNAGINTIDLILNASNLQKGTVKFDEKEINFKDLFNQVFNEKKSVAEMKNLKLEQIVEEGEYMLKGDPMWIKEVINNLVSNAISYTKEGGATMSLAHLEGGKMIFKVKDTGVGISEEDKKVLFTEGGRGKDSTKVNVDSTGYGLFTVKLVAGGHGGRVWAESEGAGKGSTFCVELPLSS